MFPLLCTFSVPMSHLLFVYQAFAFPFKVSFIACFNRELSVVCALCNICSDIQFTYSVHFCDTKTFSKGKQRKSNQGDVVQVNGDKQVTIDYYSPFEETHLPVHKSMF